MIPNSVFAKAIVTNHRRLSDPHVYVLPRTASSRISATRVLAALEGAARGSPGLAAGTDPQAYACGFTNAVISYELYFSIDDFTQLSVVQSELVAHLEDSLLRAATAL